MTRLDAHSAAASPLTPAAFHILLALAAGERHGYAIMREAETSGFRMGPGTLYGSIKRLIEEGSIEECTPVHQTEVDERRRYYRITQSGLHAVKVESARLAALVQRASTRGLLDTAPGEAS